MSARYRRIGQIRRRAARSINRPLTAFLWGTLVWAMLSAAAFAQQVEPPGGAGPPEWPAAAAAGQFGAIQIATTDPDQLIAGWEQPSPAVALVTTTQAFVNQPIVTFIIFRGCRADASGNCDVTVDFETSGPDGKRYDTTPAVRVWVGRPPAPDLNFQLSQTGYDISFAASDPLGSYRVHATIIDHVAGVALDTEEDLTVAAEKQTVQEPTTGPAFREPSPPVLLEPLGKSGRPGHDTSVFRRGL